MPVQDGKVMHDNAKTTNNTFKTPEEIVETHVEMNGVTNSPDDAVGAITSHINKTMDDEPSNK